MVLGFALSHGAFASIVMELKSEDVARFKQFHWLDRKSLKMLSPLIGKNDTLLFCSVRSHGKSLDL